MPFAPFSLRAVVSSASMIGPPGARLRAEGFFASNSACSTVQWADGWPRPYEGGARPGVGGRLGSFSSEIQGEFEEFADGT